MKRLVKLLIPNRRGLEKRWWHRLANVFIYGSTILILIGTISLTISGKSNFEEYEYTSYSFRSDYEAAKGKEITCIFRTYTSIPSSIDCGEFINVTYFLDAYAEGRGTQEELSGLRADYSDERILKGLKNTGNLDNIKVKRTTTNKFGSILQMAGIMIAVPLAWFIFWETIFYRALLYVILGKRRKTRITEE